MKNLEQELALFTGSESFYHHPLFRKYIYTEGVQYLAEKGSAYWLLDYIFAKQEENKAIQKEPFQAWIIKVKEDKSAIIRVEDGNLEQGHFCISRRKGKIGNTLLSYFDVLAYCGKCLSI